MGTKWGKARERNKPTENFSPHTHTLLGYSSFGHREGFPSLDLKASTQTLLPLPPPLAITLPGLPGGLNRRKQKYNFLHSLWFVGCHFLFLRLEIKNFSWSFFCLHLVHTSMIWLLLSLNLKILGKKIQETHAWFSDVLSSVIFPQSTYYYLFFRVFN